MELYLPILFCSREFSGEISSTQEGRQQFPLTGINSWVEKKSEICDIKMYKDKSVVYCRMPGPRAEVMDYQRLLP